MLEVEGIDKLAFQLEELEDKTKDWTPALNEAALFMERQTKLRFAKQQDPDGNPWRPLAQSTLKEKRRRKAPRTILRDRGVLAAGISARPASATQASVETTAGAEYGIWHQLGTRRMPQRRYLGFSASDIKQVEQILVGHVEDL